MRILLKTTLVFALFAMVPANADQNDPELVGLFDRLHETENHVEAVSITNQIWRVWRHFDDEDVTLLMAQGMQSMHGADLKVAVEYFSKVVDLAPEFAEGWNARATAYYMMGEYELSTSDVKQTLRLEPRHFGALSGQGLIYMQLENHLAALVFLERALQYNPHMHNISESIKLIRKQIQQNII